MDEKKAAFLKEAIPDIAIEYCVENFTGTLDFYLEMLEDWAKADHLSNMNQAFEKNDFVTYRIEAHSLKGTSRSVGLNHIGKLCEDLQFACDRSDYDYVMNHHQETASIIAQTIDTVNRCLNLA